MTPPRTMPATACQGCNDTGRVLRFYSRGPNSPPGNTLLGCPMCERGATYSAMLKGEVIPQFGSSAEHPRTAPATPEERDAMVDAAIRDSVIENHGPIEGEIRRAVYAALAEAMWPPSPAEERE